MFFFFNQKSAYEMRISDWSSDVCSSDLKSRQWLEAGDFSSASATNGWRALAALERLDGDLAAAGRAYDKALAITPEDATLWTEIGHLRSAESRGGKEGGNKCRAR